MSAARPPFVDAHFHLWDHGVLRYPWLDAAENAAIAPDYRIADYRAELSAWNLVGAVHVDAGADPSQGADETVWLNRVAQDDGLPSGIIARVELNHPAVEPQLAWQAGHPRVKGIRHLINWHPTDPSRRAYDTDLTRDPNWRAGYALLGRYGLSYDFHGFPPQLAGLAEVAARHPDVPVILNHLALPIVADGLEEWRAGLIAFAAMPHAAIKLSGAGFVGPCFAPAGFADIVAEVIDRFGTNRVMVATNFPTDRLAADLDRTLGAYEALLTGFSDEERRDLWGRNANRIYRLGLNL
ncbi:MAG TPA: amidohydrolase family protein [Sphingomonas sanguinis]|uniref:amidohydrolase family protein n=1 Tax=Sphingomonas sanguinis TaxID=33051 RepID=UPI002AC0590C|nr:amidohydrolase family protein [Sphingomonas sanguinis]HJO64818.1 amidohydrolase family protein [Sphingomonas sanguinis]